MTDKQDLDTPSGEQEKTPDTAGLIGTTLAVLAGVNLIVGMGVPLIPWLISGFLAIPLLVLGGFAKPPLRKFVLIMGFLCLIPPAILGLVEFGPRIFG
ncbi:MAG: hypothetical protein V2A76_09230 [Planctomycetota bacterium]